MSLCHYVWLLIMYKHHVNSKLKAMAHAGRMRIFNLICVPRNSKTHYAQTRIVLSLAPLPYN
jgi:hypothetical protein